MPEQREKVIPIFPNTDLVWRLLHRVLLGLEWEKVKKDYRRSGKPFGEGRGLEIWVHYGTLTTAN